MCSPAPSGGRSQPAKRCEQPRRFLRKCSPEPAVMRPTGRGANKIGCISVSTVRVPTRGSPANHRRKLQSIRHVLAAMPFSPCFALREAYCPFLAPPLRPSFPAPLPCSLGHFAPSALRWYYLLVPYIVLFVLHIHLNEGCGLRRGTVGFD